MKMVKVNLDWTYRHRETPRTEFVNYGPGRGVLVPEAWAMAMGFEIVDESPGPNPEPGPGMAEVEDVLALEWFVHRGIRSDVAAGLVAAGFKSLEAIRGATEAELLAVPGVGKAYLRKISAGLQEE